MKINEFKKIIVLTAILTLLIGNLYAQLEKIRQIDSLMKRVNKNGIFNGNILVAKDGKIIFNSSLGYADASRQKMLTTDYRFNIGSITKEFSAVSILKLQEQGKLNLDDKVSKFITALPKWADKITIKNLLQYTSGLPDINWNTIKSDEDVLNDLKKIYTLLFEPGTNSNYNNNNVLLRQFIVQKITGMPFNLFAEKYIFAPCNMYSSLMNPSKDVKDIAKSFTDDFIEDPTDLPISGVAFVTTYDLFQWVMNLHNEKLINKKSIYESGQAFRAAQSGLGNVTFENTTLKEHQHDGQSRNFEAFMYSDVPEKIVIILLTNNKNGKLSAITTAIKAILKEEPYSIPKKSMYKYLKKYTDSLKIEEVISIYTNLKATKNNELDFQSEDDLNTLGYDLLNAKRINDAIQILNLNMQQFPFSANVYDSIAEAYYLKGDLKSAVINYKKSFAIDPKNENAKQMIERIEKAN